MPAITRLTCAIAVFSGVSSFAFVQGPVPAAPQTGQPVAPPAAAPAPAPGRQGARGPAPAAPDRPLTKVPTPSDEGDFVIGPAPYAPAPELTVADGVPKGKLIEFVMKSEDSKIYKGIARGQTGTVPYERRVTVYVPAGYAPGTAAPFIVVQDGGPGTYLNTTPPVLDSMIAQKRIPAIVGVFVANGGGDAQGSERGLEYDTVSGLYAEFIETEVLPRVAKEAGVTLTRDPEGRATMGGSSGAAAAFSMAWFHPEWYHRVLSYSGTFVNQQSPLNPETPHGAWEYHENIIPKSPVKPIRIWMHVGQRDNGATRDEASLHNWVMANDRMAAVLKAKGYHYQYVFAMDSGHTEGAVIRHTLPLALEWLWKGYPIK